MALVVKNPPANAGDEKTRVQPLGRGAIRRRKWQPIPVFLPGESQGQRSLVGYSPRSCKELDTTEATKHSTHVMKKGVNIVIYQYCHPAYLTYMQSTS